MWIYAVTLMPFLAIASSVALIITVAVVIISQPIRIRATGFC